MITFPNAPKNYDQTHQSQVQQAITAEDKKNLKVSGVIDKLMFRDTADGTLKTVVVTSGAFVIT